MNDTYYSPTKGGLPVAKFYYKGSHSHPVRRTIIVVKSSCSTLTGYELREGVKTRSLKKAPVKTYIKDKIATENQLRSKKRSRSSTLNRSKLFDLLKTGP